MSKTAEFNTREFAESYKKRAENAVGYELKLLKIKAGEKETYVVLNEKQDA